MRAFVLKITGDVPDLATRQAIAAFIRWYNGWVKEVKKGEIPGLDKVPDLNDEEEQEQLKHYWLNNVSKVVEYSKSPLREDGSPKVLEMTGEWLEELLTESNIEFTPDMIKRAVKRYNDQSKVMASSGGPLFDLGVRGTRRSVLKAVQLIAKTQVLEFSNTLTIENETDWRHLVWGKDASRQTITQTEMDD